MTFKMLASALETTLETTVLGCICIGAIIGNLSLFCIVYKNKDLRTITNLFILNLAAADIMVSVLSMPVSAVTIIQQRWIFGHTACVVFGYFTILSFIASVMSLGMIAINRYFYIVKWKTYSKTFSKKRGLLSAGGVWLLSITLASPPLFGWAEYRFIPGKSYCFVYWPSNPYFMYFMIATCFCGPLAAMFFSYYNILTFTRNAKRHLALAMARNSVCVLHVPMPRNVASTEETRLSEGIQSTSRMPDSKGIQSSSTISDSKRIQSSSTISDSKRIQSASTISDSMRIQSSSTISDSKGIQSASTISDSKRIQSSSTISDSKGIQSTSTMSDSTRQEGNPEPPLERSTHGPKLNDHNEQTVRPRARQASMEETKITNMFILMVALFLVCWSPFAVTMFFDVYYPRPLPRAVNIVSLLFGYLNSVCNPILYGVKNSAFRKGFADLYSKLMPNCLKSTSVADIERH